MQTTILLKKCLINMNHTSVTFGNLFIFLYWRLWIVYGSKQGYMETINHTNSLCFKKIKTIVDGDRLSNRYRKWNEMQTTILLKKCLMNMNHTRVTFGNLFWFLYWRLWIVYGSKQGYMETLLTIQIAYVLRKAIVVGLYCHLPLFVNRWRWVRTVNIWFRYNNFWAKY